MRESEPEPRPTESIAAPPPNPSLAHVCPILVGFDFTDRSVSPPELPELEGMVNDVIAWWRTLRHMGIHPANVFVITDQPPSEVERRMRQAGVWDEALRERLFRFTGEQELSTFVQSHAFPTLSDDESGSIENAKVLLMWSGHGGVDASDRAKPPALYMPDGSHLVVSQLVGLVKSLWSWVGWQPGEPPTMVAVLSACHTAELDLGTAGDPVSFAELGTVAIAASSRNEVAHEIYVDGQYRSALSWAMTTVLSRYRNHPDGAVALTYAELLFRIRSLLAAIDVPDEPRLFAPQDEANRLILRGFGDLEVGESQAKAGNPIEIYPTTDGECVLFSIESQHKQIGRLLVVGGGAGWDPSWQAAGYQPNRLYFVWTGAPDWSSFDTLPEFKSWSMKSSLKAEGGLDLENLPANTSLEAFPMASWSKKANFSAKPSHVIRAGGEIQRWVDVASDSKGKRTLTFYRKDGQSDESKASVRLSFRPQSDQVTGLTHSVVETEA